VHITVLRPSHGYGLGKTVPYSGEGLFMELALQQQDWYQLMIDDCKAILTEAVFTSNWSLLEGYHQLGARLICDTDFQKHAKGNNKFLETVSKNIGISTRNLYHAMRFYEKYPDINKLPDGKAATWKKVITKYLPEKKEAEELPDYKYECPKCGFRW